jgi:hypothetical protein
MVWNGPGISIFSERAFSLRPCCVQGKEKHHGIQGNDGAWQDATLCNSVIIDSKLITKIMKKNIGLVMLGLLMGALLSSFITFSGTSTKYIKLEEDFVIESGGIIKKGTYLRVDKSFSEGFTRYILFLNYKGESGTTFEEFDKTNLVKPYWIYRTDSLNDK